MDKKELLALFISKIKCKIETESNYVLINNTNYLNKDYRSSLVRDMKDKKLLEKYLKNEFEYYGWGRFKICKISSSARLCYNDFIKEYNIEDSDYVFEDTSFKFIGDNGNENCANFDCRIKNNFYECKCEEFFKEHKDYFVSHFYKKLLSDEFGIGEIEELGDYLFPTLKQFGLLDFEGDIYSLNFDMKQFITHLLALGNREKYKDETVSLKYKWYFPKNDNRELEEFKNIVFYEFNKIKESNIIEEYLNKKNIVIELKTYDIPEEVIKI